MKKSKQNKAILFCKNFFLILQTQQQELNIQPLQQEKSLP